MEKWQWAITLAAPVLVGLFTRFCPKEKMLLFLKPKCEKLGDIISKFLILRIGWRAAERVEEGIISTILTVLGHIPLYINAGLLKDNNQKRLKAHAKRREKK